MVIYLDCPSPDSSSGPFPGRNATYPRARRAAVWLSVWSCFEWGLHSISRYRKTGGLLHRHSTLTVRRRRYHFCCTFLGVTSTGRYPAPCPLKPGLSSLRLSLMRPSVLLEKINRFLNREHTSAYKFPYYRIVWYSFAGYSEEIL